MVDQKTRVSYEHLAIFFESLPAGSLGLPTTEPDHVRRRPAAVHFLNRQYDLDLAFFDFRACSHPCSVKTDVPPYLHTRAHPRCLVDDEGVLEAGRPGLGEVLHPQIGPGHHLLGEAAPPQQQEVPDRGPPERQAGALLVPVPGPEEEQHHRREEDHQAIPQQRLPVPPSPAT